MRMTSSRRPAKTVICSLLLLLFFTAWNHLHAQSQLRVFNIDTSRYPIISADILALDSLGKQIQGLTAADFHVVENDLDGIVTLLSCPEPPPPQPAIVVISFDVSSSMLTGPPGGQSFDLAKLTATNLISTLQIPPATVAILSCNDEAVIDQDLTTNRSKVFNAIDGLRPFGSNDFVEQLLDPLKGLMTIAQSGTGAVKRYAILLTDAFGERIDPGVIDVCKEICSTYQIHFYAVIYTPEGVQANSIRASLQELAAASGGEVFDASEAEQSLDIARQLQVRLDGASPCRIEWLSNGGCDFDKTARISIPKLALERPVTYRIPDDRSLAGAQLLVSGSSVRFGPVMPGRIRDTTITIQAVNKDVTVYGIASSNPRFTVISGGAPPEFIVPRNKSRTVRIRFTPTDSSEQFAILNIVTNTCEPTLLTMSGGFRRRGDISLQLLGPNGGEILAAGEDSVLTWTGVVADEPVRLEYSTDAGTSWKLIRDNAIGLRYPWRVPATPSNTCLARVSLMSFNPLVLMVANGNGAVREVEESQNGKLIVTVDKDMVNIWDAKTGVRQQQLYHPMVRSARIFGNDKVASVGGDGLVRVWFLEDGFMRTIGANAIPLNSAQFNANGFYLLTAGTKISTSPNLLIWSLLSGTVWKAMDSSRQFDISYTSASFSPDQSLVVAGGNSSKVPVFSVATGRAIQTLSYPGTVTTTSFSSDGKRILVGGDRGVDIWDATTFTRLRNVPAGPVTWADFAPDGNTIAVAGKRSIDLWELYTGTFIRSIDGHEGTTTCVRYNFKGNHLLSASQDGTARVWDLEDITPPSDDSDTLWSIVASSAVAHNIDMGKVLVGSFHDSTVIAFIRNTGTTTLSVRQIKLYGSDFTDFKLTTQNTPFTIAPGAAHAVEVRFSPGAVGQRSATIDLILPDTIIRLSMRGEGVMPVVQVTPEQLDFGIVEVGGTKDSIVAMAVKNIGTEVVTIDSTTLFGPGAARFSVVSGGGTFTLPPDSGRTMQVRFAPAEAERSSAGIRFHYNGTGSPTVMQLFGQGATDLAPVLETPSEIRLQALVCAADTAFIDIPIRNRGAGTLDISGVVIGGADAGDFSLATPFDPVSVPSGGSTDIRLSFVPAVSGTRSAQLAIHSNADPSPWMIPLHGRGDSVAIGLSTQSIDLGTLCPGERIDTAISITNSGSIATQIAGSAEGAAVLENASWLLGGGSSATVQFHVTPTAEGMYRSSIIFTDTICGATAILEVKARVERPGIESSLQAMVATIGSSADSLLTITNTSERDVVITDAVSDDNHFEVVPGQLPLALPAGATGTLLVRFTPSDDDPVNAMLHFSGPPCIQAALPLTGLTHVTATLIIPDLHAAPGDTVSIPIRIRNADRLLRSGVTGIATSLRVNASVLMPVQPTPVGVPDASDPDASYIVIPLLLSATPGHDSTLMSLRFIALVGNTDTTELQLEGSKPIGGTADILEIPGLFTLDSICGLSSRLIVITAPTVLKQIAPNPVTSVTSIQFQAPEQEYVQIVINDLYGRRAVELFDGVVDGSEQSIAFDTSTLASGLYYCTLQTSVRTITRLVVIQK
jgi:WD40 repeat protein